MHSATIKTPKQLTEQFEGLKFRLKSMLNGGPPKPIVVAFTSCKSAEGVSSIAANFASTLRADKDRVLLMDGDLRRPSLHRLLKRSQLKRLEANGINMNGGSEQAHDPHSEPTDPGRRSLIEVEANALMRSGSLAPSTWHFVRGEANIDMLVARRRVTDPGALFSTREFDEFLEKARQQYDVIVLDCPPVYTGSGSTMLSSKADGVVMVVEAGRVRRQVISRAIELLEETGANVLGVVLNKRRYPIPQFVYRML